MTSIMEMLLQHKNKRRFNVFVLTLQDVNTPKSGPPIMIPDGFSVVIKAGSTNSGLVYISSSLRNTSDPTKRFNLAPGHSVRLFINSMNMVWAKTNSIGNTVQFICEGDTKK